MIGRKENDINAETRLYPITKTIAFAAAGEHFSIEISIPLYVWDTLKRDSATWDRIVSSAKQRAAQYVGNWRVLGARSDERATVDELLGKHIAERVQGEFEELQRLAGNGAWETPDFALEPWQQKMVN